MNPLKFSRAALLSLIIATGCMSAASAFAGDSVDNPKYQMWAKFKVGSSNTVAADISRGQTTVHIETKRTLISVSADNVVVETVTTAKVMGQDRSQPAVRETISSKTDHTEFKESGDKDVEAMNKTFKCKVYNGDVGAMGGGGAKAGAAAAGNKAVLYVSDTVPGGLVEMDVTSAAGMNVTFILTAMEVK